MKFAYLGVLAGLLVALAGCSDDSDTGSTSEATRAADSDSEQVESDATDGETSDADATDGEASDAEETDADQGNADESDAGSDAHETANSETDEEAAEAAPCGGLEFSINSETMGEEEAVVAVLLDASPAPPQRYENDWLVEFRDPDGERLEDVELTRVQPFMPAHNHDGTFDPTIEEGDEPGQFLVKAINLWMPGTWEVRFWVESESAGEDYIVLGACITE